MPDTYESYNCFIASPGDVVKERLMAEDAIEAINRTIRDTLHVHINVRKWEHRAPVAPHLPDERLQELLNHEVERAHFFVLILYRRYGSTEPGHNKSNTDREVDAILRRYRANPRLKILAYFRELPDNPDRGTQEARVREFRDRLAREGIAYHEYHTEGEFKERFTHDFYDVVLRMKLSSFKHEMLRRFWQLGAPSGRPRLALLYPPVQRDVPTESVQSTFWLNRLATQVYFEDYKAIDKLVRGLVGIGFSDWHVHPCTDPPSDLVDCNRVWVCLPRNRLGLEHLARYSDRCSFEFRREPGRRPTELVWRKGRKSTIIVRSPLANYLELQRSSLDTSGDWRPDLGRILAKDYAVLARFGDIASSDPAVEEPLRDFFLAGIRGLGTWGAAWFVDRRNRIFQRYAENADIQLLLEVTFRNSRVADVVDVSDRPAGYFENENDLVTIRRHIDEFRGLR